MARIYNMRRSVVMGYGPRLDAAIKAARKNADGTLDARTKVARELATINHRPARGYRPIVEISTRRFPKAIRPTHVYRADGAHMPYERWLSLVPACDDIVGMMFEDGKTVGVVP